MVSCSSEFILKAERDTMCRLLVKSGRASLLHLACGDGLAVHSFTGAICTATRLPSTSTLQLHTKANGRMLFSFTNGQVLKNLQPLIDWYGWANVEREVGKPRNDSEFFFMPILMNRESWHVEIDVVSMMFQALPKESQNMPTNKLLCQRT